MQFKDLINTRRAIAEIKNEKLPVTTAYKLVKFFNETSGDEDFYNEQVRNALKDYTNENGAVEVPPEKAGEVMARISEIDKTEAQIPQNIKFKLSEFEGIQTSLMVVEALSPLIEE